MSTMDTFTMSGFRSNISFNIFEYRSMRPTLLFGTRPFVAIVFMMLFSACQSDIITAKVINEQQVNRLKKTSSSEGKKSIDGKDSFKQSVTIRIEGVVGILKAIDKRGDRIIVQMDNGKLLRLKMTGLSKSHLTIKTGQRISFSMHESVEIIRNRFLHGVDGSSVAREAPGSSGERENYNSYYNRGPTGHHGTQWVDVMDVPARVVDIDYNQSTVRLITQKGRAFTVQLSGANEDINGILPNESVLVRFKEIDEINQIDQ
jgi:hypothetical protein